MHLKKNIAFIVALLLMLSNMIGYSVYASESDDVKYIIFTDDYVKKTGESADIETMSALGIMPKNTNANRFVTRGKAARYLSLMFSHGYKSDAVKNIYKDVPEEHIYSEAISICYDFDIMKSDNGYFRPNESMSVEDTVIAFMDVLGYKKTITNGESKKKMYKKYPVYTKLTYGIRASGSGITEGQFATIACRAFYENLVEETYFSNEKLIQANVGQKNLIEDYMKIYRVRGIVNTIGNVGFSGYNSSNDIITVDNVQMQGKNLDLSLLGRYVDAYYIDDNGVFSLLGVAIKNGDAVQKRLHHTMLDRNSSGYTKLNIVASENGKSKNYKIHQNANIIYNGRPVSTYEKSDICPVYGEMLLIDENHDDEYELVIVWDFDVKQVKYVYYYANAVSCFDESIYSEINDENTSYLCYRDGVECEINDLQMNDVISVAKSKGNDDVSCIIFATTEAVEGKITAKDEDTVTIDNKTYSISPYCESLDIGASDVYYKDVYGGIVKLYTTRSDRYMYGYLLDAGKKGQFDECCIKVFSENGDMEILKISPKVKVDGVQMTSVEFIDNVSLNVLIKYRTNADYEINSILYPTNNGLGKDPGYDLENFSLDWKGSARYSSQHRTVGGYNFGASNTIIMRIPTYSTATEKNYYVMDTSYLVNGFGYDFEIYESNEFYEPDIVLVKMGWEYGRKINEYDKNQSIVVTSISTEMYKEEVYTKITGFSKGNTEYMYVPENATFSWNSVFELSYGNTYPCPNNEDIFTANDLKKGDIIQVGDVDSIVNGIRVLYRNDLEHSIHSNYREVIYPAITDLSKIDETWHYQCLVGQGTIYYVGESRVIIQTGQNLYRSAAINLNDRTRYIGLLYDTSTKTIRLAKPSDWAKGRRIVFHSNHCDMNSIIIFK